MENISLPSMAGNDGPGSRLHASSSKLLMKIGSEKRIEGSKRSLVIEPDMANQAHLKRDDSIDYIVTSQTPTGPGDRAEPDRTSDDYSLPREKSFSRLRKDANLRSKHNVVRVRPEATLDQEKAAKESLKVARLAQINDRIETIQKGLANLDKQQENIYNDVLTMSDTMYDQTLLDILKRQ